MENNDCETMFNSRVTDSQLVPTENKNDDDGEAGVSS